MVKIGSVSIYKKLDNFFNLEDDGWLGSDVAHSIKLNKDIVLWLFGDTFVGRKFKNSRGSKWSFINNSIGIMNLENGLPAGMKYIWKEKKGRPESFFLTTPYIPGDFLWPTNGIIIDNVLVIFAMAVNSTLDNTIDIAGTVVMKIENYEDDPSAWLIDLWDFNYDNGVAHAGLHIENDFLYFFITNRKFFVDGMMLGRMPIDLIKNKSKSNKLEFFSGNNWNYSSDNAIQLFMPSNTETNIYYCKNTNLYFSTTYRPHENRILLTWSPKLTGPWSDPLAIFDIPEKNKSFPVHSYAIRIHDWLSMDSGNLIISYATNEFGGMDNLMTTEGLDIYRPRFVEVCLEG